MLWAPGMTRLTSVALAALALILDLACVEPDPSTAPAMGEKGDGETKPPADPRLAPTCTAAPVPATPVTAEGVRVLAGALLPGTDVFGLGGGAVRSFSDSPIPDGGLTWRIATAAPGPVYVWVAEPTDNPIAVTLDDALAADVTDDRGWHRYRFVVAAPGEHHLDVHLARAAEVTGIAVASAIVPGDLLALPKLDDPPVYGPRAYRLATPRFAGARFAAGHADRFADDPTAWTPSVGPGEVAAPIVAAGFGGQRLAMALGVATNPLHLAIPASVEVTVSDLVQVGGPNVIPAAAVDVRVLSIQTVATGPIGSRPVTERVWRPEGRLLVRDEAWCTRPTPTPAAPTVPPGVQGGFGGGWARAILAPADQRTFWITVPLPAVAAGVAGDYRGQARIVVDGFAGDAITVPLHVTQKPRDLEPAPGLHGAFYFGCRAPLWCAAPGNGLAVDTPRMQRHLAELRALGFDSLWGLEGLQPIAGAPSQLELAVSAGLDRYAVLPGTTLDDHATLPWYDATLPGALGIPSWDAWLGDEPSTPADVTRLVESNRRHVEYCGTYPAPPWVCPPDLVHGGALTLSGNRAAFDELADQVRTVLLAITAYATPTDVDRMTARGKRPLYYFAVPHSDALASRVFAGTYPRALGYAGMFVYAYTGDGDHRENALALDDDHGLPVPTRAAQAIREGIDDVRVHAALRDALKGRDVDCATTPSHPVLADACAVVREIECVPYNPACDRAAGADRHISQYATGRTTVGLDAVRARALAALLAVDAVPLSTP